MQFKPMTAIIVLFLLISSLLVAGCATQNTTSSPTVSQDKMFRTNETFAVLGRDWMVERHLKFNENSELITESGQLIARADELISAYIIDQRIQAVQNAPTNTPTPNPTVTPTPTPSTHHNPVLTAFVENVKTAAYAQGHTVDVWEVTWNGDSSVIVHETVRGILSNDKPVVLTYGASAFNNAEAVTNALSQGVWTGCSQRDSYVVEPNGKDVINVYYNTVGHYPNKYYQIECTKGNAVNLPIEVTTNTQYDNILVSSVVVSYGSELAR
jgi:hypothetical protein